MSRAAPARRTSLWRTPRTRALLVVGTISAVVAVTGLAARTYTDFLWFRELGQERVFVTALAWQVLALATVGLGTACFVLLNLAIVERRSGTAEPTDRRLIAFVRRYRRLVYPLVAIACGLAAVDLRPDDLSQTLLLWANRSDFGTQDPLFHRDVGFFVFSLPLHREVARWLLETCVMAAGASLAAYTVTGARVARAHAFGLAALTLLVIAWRFRLDQFALALPHRGSVVPGASYTEAHVRLPTLRILAILSLAAAVFCLYGMVRRPRPILFVAVAAVAAVTIAAAGALPALVERFDVSPQVLTRQRPYLADAIAATRRAFELDRVDVRTLAGDGRLSAADMAAGRTTIENVPLWNAGVLRPAMRELQSIGAYYGFRTAAVDRYRIGRSSRVLTVAARELDLRHVRGASRTWTNERFAYTHGYGVVAAVAGGADADGYPQFAQGEFGSRRNPLRLTQPRIYYGEQSGPDVPYHVVGSRRGEVEDPRPGSEAPDYHYDGPGGIPVSGLLERAAFAARFSDLKLLLTQTVTAGSRLVLHRDVGERVRLLAPFLRWDARPQPAIVDGRVVFLMHGYTTSSSYPYAAPVRLGDRRVNYIRASAVAAVDAYSGAVRMYADPSDPILRAWRGAYPSLFVDLAQMPPELRAHLRYPRPLFAAQSEAYATYHADDTTGFWTGADAWQPSIAVSGPVEDAGEIHFPDPDERRESQARPDYLLARLPGDDRERFMLTTSFTPRGRQNLVGYLAGSIDAGGRPQLTLLSLPRDRLTIGPSQATREILADPEVNHRLQILNRESRDLGKSSVNRTVLGTPQLVPVGDALVHVQAVYLTAGGSGLPRLQLVTAYANGRVVHGRDVETALRRAVR